MNEKKVTCFVTHGYNLTVLRREEEDVGEHVRLHLHAQFKHCLLIFGAV